MSGFPEQAQVSPQYYAPFDERDEAANKAARNAISRKYTRMYCVTLDDQVRWQLKVRPGGEPITTWGSADEHWEEAGSGGLPADGTITDAMLSTDVKWGSISALKVIFGTISDGFTKFQDFLGNLHGRVAALEDSPGGVTSVNTHTGAVTLSKADVGLGNVTDDAQVKRSELGVAGGVVVSDANNKIPFEQLPDSILGGNRYKGTYMFGNNRISSPDAALNNAILPAPSASNTGWYFIVQDEGTLNGKIYNVGDWLVSNGAAGWNKVDAVQSVLTVAGHIGHIILTGADLSDSTAVGRAVLTAADAATARTALGIYINKPRAIYFTATKLSMPYAFIEKVVFETVKLIVGVPHIRYQLVLPGETLSAKPYRTDTEITADINALTGPELAAGFAVWASSMKTVAPAATPAVGITTGAFFGHALIRISPLA